MPTTSAQDHRGRYEKIADHDDGWNSSERASETAHSPIIDILTGEDHDISFRAGPKAE